MTQDDRSVAILVGGAGMDEEKLQLSTSDQFWRFIASLRGQKTIDRAELERRLDSRSEQQSAKLATATPAITEPKADYDVEAN